MEPRVWGRNGGAGLPGSEGGLGACSPTRGPMLRSPSLCCGPRWTGDSPGRGSRLLPVVAVLGALCSIWEITSPSLCFLTCETGEPLSSRSSAWLGASIEVSRDGERGGEPPGWVGIPRGSRETARPSPRLVGDRQGGPPEASCAVCVHSWRRSHLPGTEPPRQLGANRPELPR